MLKSHVTKGKPHLSDGYRTVYSRDYVQMGTKDSVVQDSGELIFTEHIYRSGIVLPTFTLPLLNLTIALEVDILPLIL